MEVHRELGPGFSEVIYKDALEIELIEHNIPYIKVTMNYLAVSGCKLGIIGNFGELSFKYRRVILT